MAELLVGGAFLSAALNVLFDRLASRQVAHFFRRKKLGEGLLKKFKIVLLAVNVLLDDAEMKELSNPGVKEWLDELKDAIYDAEDLLDEISTVATKPKTKSGFFTGSKFKARRVEEIIEKINTILSHKDLLGLSEGVGGNFIRREPTTSLVEDAFIGRDAEKQKIIESLLLDVTGGDEIPVIAIVGMGGIGKTTLAKIIYNDEKVEEYFDLRAWVCVTEEVDVFRLTKIILESVTSSDSNNITDLNLLQLRLKQELSEKKLLLVLDDVWDDNYSKWRKICAPFATVSSGSKIIVTTRNSSVALMMGTNSSHSLEHLSDDFSWKLFEYHAFGERRNLNAHPHLEEIGKHILEKCKGLPLAIKTIAGALRGKDDVKEWVNILKSEIWDLSSIGERNILPVLKLSFHYLPSHLKRCFAYCSIFPQDHLFVKKSLILLWMAEGFLLDRDNNMEELGEKYFDELYSRSFFQKSSGRIGGCFVMHDIMIDLAQYVSGKFCLAFQRSESRRVSEKVRHFSYSKRQFDVLNKIKPIVKATNLRTFLSVDLRESYFGKLSLSTKLLSDLLPNLGCVRVLSFSGYDHLSQLPDSICSLVHLRYLDLSWTAIKSLPDTICLLYNLQTLLLAYCRKFTKLPTNLGDLINLRHLDISETALNKMPPRIRKLESLQTLSTFIVGENNCSGLGELKEFRHLKGSLSILGMHNVKNVADVMEANLKEKVGIEELLFSWGLGTKVAENENDILDELEPCENLNNLTLNNYGGTRFSNWLGDDSLFNLTYLKLSDCAHCLSLPSLGQLPSLEKLYVHKLTSLKRVDSEFYKNEFSSIKPFQKLVILEFKEMSELEEWVTSGGGNNYDFPKLETLSIEKCPKLCGNLPKLLPSLRDFWISGCSELTAIIPGCAPLQSLKLECKNVVFENMSSLNPLISLEIRGHQNSFPNGMRESCNNLEELSIDREELSIDRWFFLTHCQDDGLPTRLRKLCILCCDDLEFLPKEMSHKYTLLEELKLESSCDSMKYFPLGLCPALRYLWIYNCKNLDSFSILDDHDENLKSLQTLRIEGCDKLINFPSGGLPTPNLRLLHIWKCKNLKSLPERMNTQLTSLQSLAIWECEKIESFPAGGLPSSVRIHHIGGCKKLMAKRREWDLHTLLFLNSLSIGGCEEIETFPEAEWDLPTSITELTISELPNLVRIDASRLLKLTSLKELDIQDCPKVKFDPKLRNTQDLPSSFSELSIRHCPFLAKQLRTTKRDLIPVLRIDNEVVL